MVCSGQEPHGRKDAVPPYLPNQPVVWPDIIIEKNRKSSVSPGTGMTAAEETPENVMKESKEKKQVLLTIREESELYNPFDESLLNGDVIEFLGDRIRGTKGDIVLNIRSGCPLDEERVRKTFANQCTDFLIRLKGDKKRNSLRQLCMFIIGITFILLWLFVSAISEGVGAEVLSIIGSFAMWECANVWIVDNPEIRIEELFLKRLKQAEITFQYVSED